MAKKAQKDSDFSENQVSFPHAGEVQRVDIGVLTYSYQFIAVLENDGHWKIDEVIVGDEGDPAKREIRKVENRKTLQAMLRNMK